MGNFKGAVAVVASLTLVSGCSLLSQGDDDADDPETVTVTSGEDADADSDEDRDEDSDSEQETHTETATETAEETEPDSETETSSDSPDPSSSTGNLPTSASSYADGFVRAWGIGDRQDASRYATSTAVSSLFGADARGGSNWSRDTSVDQGSRTQVRYTNDDDLVLYVLVDRSTASSGNEHAVVGASLEYESSSAGEDDDSEGFADTTVPETSTGDYCDALVRAWGSGKRGTADRYADSTAMRQLFDEHGTGGSGWSQTSVSRYNAVYTNTDGTKLTLYFNSVSVSNGWGDGVYYAEFTS